MDTFAGGGANSSGHADGLGAAARFHTPSALATTADGTVYVADRLNHRVRVINRYGATRTLAGSGTAGHADGKAVHAAFNTPTGLALSGAVRPDVLYVADHRNHRMRRVHLPSGNVSTLAGSGRVGSADGKAGNASFDRPFGLALSRDAATLYVSDYGNHKLRTVSTAVILRASQLDNYSASTARPIRPEMDPRVELREPNYVAAAPLTCRANGGGSPCCASRNDDKNVALLAIYSRLTTSDLVAVPHGELMPRPSQDRQNRPPQLGFDSPLCDLLGLCIVATLVLLLCSAAHERGAWGKSGLSCSFMLLLLLQGAAWLLPAAEAARI